jgi:hypothetical protein
VVWAVHLEEEWEVLPVVWVGHLEGAWEDPVVLEVCTAMFSEHMCVGYFDKQFIDDQLHVIG